MFTHTVPVVVLNIYADQASVLAVAKFCPVVTSLMPQKCNEGLLSDGMFLKKKKRLLAINYFLENASL